MDVTRSYEHCGFCAKGSAEVAMLVPGPACAICNECIDLTHDVVHQSDAIRKSVGDRLGSISHPLSPSGRAVGQAEAHEPPENRENSAEISHSAAENTASRPDAKDPLHFVIDEMAVIGRHFQDMTIDEFQALVDRRWGSADPTDQQLRAAEPVLIDLGYGDLSLSQVRQIYRAVRQEIMR